MLTFVLAPWQSLKITFQPFGMPRVVIEGRSGQSTTIVSVREAARRHGVAVASLPYSVRVLVENLERHRLHGPPGIVSDAEVAAVLGWSDNIGQGVPLHVARVILPDSSGLPVLQDIAALRDAVAGAGGDPRRVEPRVPVDVVVDHSLQVDRSASPDAVQHNLMREFERNGERYRFLKWAQQAFTGVNVFTPGTGIIHQVNLEKIASVVVEAVQDGAPIAYPDFVIGGDSHTPMINALGVLGWGVGGIDAEAAMLGEAYVFPVPEVVGVRLTGQLAAGTTTMDLSLLVTQTLRREGVVSAFVEFVGEGARRLSVPERATIANMAPEYGATCGFFPIDGETIGYLARTRSPAHAAFVERYARANDLFRAPELAEPTYARLVEIDLGTVRPSVAGPRRPQDRLDLTEVAADFRARLARPLAEGGFVAAPETLFRPAPDAAIRHGAVAIAAITACTNTSNPSVMVAAGLLARNAVRAGLKVPAHVKTSLAPGSRVVTRYLESFSLLPALETLGFHVVGYGCTTCGGKSGPLLPVMSEAVDRDGIVAAAALSGNRNFEGRIHRQVRANYIMSPPLVVAFALAGRIDIDFDLEPVGRDPSGAPVMLADLWPSPAEVAALVSWAGDAGAFREVYDAIPSGALWDALDAPKGARFAWDPASTYLVEPPFLALAEKAAARGLPDRIDGARVLGAYGDSLTTDHISPSGEIPLDSAAGRYLVSRGVEQRAFNTYVGRRCNHEVMLRGTFGNVRIRNLLVPEREGGWTRLLPEGEIVPVHEAAASYAAREVPVIVLGGREYGTGSSRDWAAKGSALLGVRAVIAESYERIHRANLIGMGIIPLVFAEAGGWRALRLDGTEVFSLSGLAAGVDHGAPIRASAEKDGRRVDFTVFADVSTMSERASLKGGGLIAGVLKSLRAEPDGPAARPREETAHVA